MDPCLRALNAIIPYQYDFSFNGAFRFIAFLALLRDIFIIIVFDVYLLDTPLARYFNMTMTVYSIRI